MLIGLVGDLVVTFTGSIFTPSG